MCTPIKIPKFEQYSVCKCGRVYGPKGEKKPHLVGESGYKYYGTVLRKNGKTFRVRMNRLVYSTFNSLDSSKEIHHINGDKLDNRLCNLQAVSKAENCLIRKRRDESKFGRNISYSGYSYQVSIKHKGVSVFRKRFKNLKDARVARDNAWNDLINSCSIAFSISDTTLSTEVESAKQ